MARIAALVVFIFFTAVSSAVGSDTLSVNAFVPIKVTDSIPLVQRLSGKDPRMNWGLASLTLISWIADSSRNQIWIRFPINNNSDNSDTIFFDCASHGNVYHAVLLENGQMYFADTAGYWTGEYALFPNAPTIGMIPLPPNSKAMVYFTHEVLKVPSSYLEFALMDGSSLYKYFYSYQQTKGIQMLVNTLTIGFLAFAFLFFLFSAFTVRDQLYTLYCLYLLMALVFCLTMWNELPYHAQTFMYKFFALRFILNETSVAWMFAFYILFGDRLLNISSQRKRFGFLLKVNVIFLVLYGLMHLVIKASGTLTSPLIEQSYFYFRIIFLPVYIVILIYILIYIKSPLKTFLMMANVVLLAGVIASVTVDYTTDVWRVAGNEVHPGALLQAAIVGETILFSLALGYNNRLIQRQRDESRRQYIEQLQANNTLIENERSSLAEKVAAAREEILEKQKQIEARKMKQLQAEFENRIQELTIQSLEAQMNPHFLFNGLSAVRDLVLKNRNEEAMQYINTFALLLRTSLNNNRKTSIALQDELEVTGHYLQIEKLRFGQEFHFSFEIAPDVDTISIEVPPKLLQPLVENAIKHGLRHSAKVPKHVRVVIGRNEDSVWIHVEDNGIGIQASRVINSQNALQGTHLGLKLMEERLAIFNQQQDTSISMEINEMTTETGEVTGTRVTMVITVPEKQKIFIL